MTDDPSSKDKFVNTVKESLEEEMSTATSSVDKGERFLTWAITRIVDASKDEVREQITDGKDDMGIDCWIKPAVASDSGGPIQLWQSKYGKSHDEAEILGFENDVKKFLDLQTWIYSSSDDMKDLRLMIDKEKLEPELYYITDQKITDGKLNTVNVLGFDQIADKLWADIEGIPPGVTETLPVEEGFEWKGCLIGAVELKELKKFVTRTQKYIYESNIRKYLQKTKINKNLKKTLQNEIDSVFYYNNGITIVVKDYKKNGKEVTLTEPQIVNGAQTSETIFEALPYISNAVGEIVVTIIKETIKAPRSNITRYRNSQNAVKGKDLISLEAYHKGISGQLKEIGYFYERQAGSWKFLENRGQVAYDGHDTFKQYLPSAHENSISSPVAIQAWLLVCFKIQPNHTPARLASCQMEPDTQTFSMLNYLRITGFCFTHIW